MEPFVVQPPQAPDTRVDSPIFDCLPGWGETEVRGVGVCDPFPDGVRACVGASRQRHGTDACEPLAVCPDDGWPALVPAEAVYVRAGSSGIGSREDPFGFLQDALDTDAPVIALAVGEYEANHVLVGDRHIVGACAEGSTLRGVGTDPAIVIRDGQVELSDVRISHPDGVGVLVEGGHLNGTGLWVDDYTGEGILLDGPTASGTLSASVFTGGSASDLHRGYGLRNTDGASLFGEDLTFRGMTGGLLVEAEAQLNDATFIDMDGRAISVYQGALVAAGIAVHNQKGTTLQCTEGSATLTAATILGSRPPTQVEFGGGVVAVQQGGRADLERVWMSEVENVALYGTNLGIIHAEDVVLGGGIRSWAPVGGQFELERATISVVGDEACVFIGETEGTATLRHTVCERAESRVAEDVALLQPNGGTLVFENGRLIETGAPDSWVSLGPSGNLTVRDVEMVGAGIGTALVGLRSETALFERVHVAGAGQLLELEFADASLVDVSSERTQGSMGTITGGTVDLLRSQLSGSEGGMSVRQATVLVSDVSLSVDGGDGLTLDEQSALSGNHLDIQGATETGLYTEGQVDLEALMVQGSGDIGLHNTGTFSNLLINGYWIDGFVTSVVDDGANSTLDE